VPTWWKFYRDQAGQALPSSLLLTGALLAVEIHVPTQLGAALTAAGKPIPASKAGWAQIDSGATLTCVHEQALIDLGIPPVGVAKVGTANGPSDRPTYPARLVFPETGWDSNTPFPLAGVDLTGQMIQFQGGQPQQILLLLGRDFLSQCVLIWNGPAAMWSIST
jgi:hypothetical protein